MSSPTQTCSTTIVATKLRLAESVTDIGSSQYWFLMNMKEYFEHYARLSDKQIFCLDKILKIEQLKREVETAQLPW